MEKLTIFVIGLLIVCVTLVPEIESRRMDSRMKSRVNCYPNGIWFDDENTCMMMCKKGCEREGCGGFRSCGKIADAPSGTRSCHCGHL